MAEGTTVPAVRAHVVGLTDVGRVREHNEDSFLVLDREAGTAVPAGRVLETDVKSAVFMIVCDGMGGAAAGEVASRMASQRVADVLSKADIAAASPDQIASLMDQSVQSANTEIFEKAKASPEMKGMGTTLTAAVVAHGRLFVSQVGDSRAYLLRKGHLNRITRDQSLVEQLIEEGTLTEEEAEKLGGRNIVLQAVGVEDALRVDTKNWELLRGDVVLLCSDGLSGMVKDARMREILQEKGADLRAAADQLIAEANSGGGRDNITVILGRFDGDALRPPMETEAGGLEAAGAAFKAPPPPEVPNPMKKVALWGGVLLVAVVALWIALLPTKANVRVRVRPSGARVRLLDAAGAEVRSVSAPDAPVRFDDLDPGDYRLQVSADRHFELVQDLPIAAQGNVELEEIRLLPRPGTLSVRAADPGVTVKLDLVPDHPKGTAITAQTIPLEKAGVARTTGSVHVGAFTAVASRPGFRTLKVEGRVDPEEDEKVEFPGLEQIEGTLVIEGAEGGQLAVVTQEGDVLFSGDAGAAVWTKPVRAVPVRVTFSRKGYRTVNETADVTEGGRAVVRVKQVVDAVRVTVSGTPGRIVAFDRFEGGRWTALPDEVVIDRAGSAPPVNLAPGRYRARLDDGSKPTEFELEPGVPHFAVSVGN